MSCLEYEAQASYLTPPNKIVDPLVPHFEKLLMGGVLFGFIGLLLVGFGPPWSPQEKTEDLTDEGAEPDYKKLKKGYVEAFTGIFIFQISMTLSTVVQRFVFGEWIGTLTGFELNELLGYAEHEPVKVYYTREVFKPETAVGLVTNSPDFSMMFHALGGLNWLFWGWLAMYAVEHFGHKWHRVLGKIAGASFLLHYLFAMNMLYTDIANHRLFNRGMLFGVWLELLVHFHLAIKAIQDKSLDYNTRVVRHMRHMAIVYVVSGEGSGQIRLMTHINYFLGRVASSFCKSTYDYSGTCAWYYAERMILLRFISLGYLWLLSKKVPADKWMRDFVQNGFMMLVPTYVLFRIIWHWELDWLMNFAVLFHNAKFVCDQVVKLCADMVLLYFGYSVVSGASADWHFIPRADDGVYLFMIKALSKILSSASLSSAYSRFNKSVHFGIWILWFARIFNATAGYSQ